MLYILAALLGYVFCKLTAPTIRTSPFFQETVIDNVMQGKQVAILIDDKATIFRLRGNKMQIVRGVGDIAFNELTLVD